MEFVILVTSIIIIVILELSAILDVKKVNKICKNKELDELIEKLPDNKTVCKELLQIIDNSNVKIEQSTDSKSKTSFYFVISNSIKLANIQGCFPRIQTIAHECIHSIQKKSLLLFNFIFSNIYLIYFFILTIILIFTKTHIDIKLHIIILLMLGTIYYIVRNILETDAIIKSKYLSQGYLLKSEMYNQEEIEKIVTTYDKINKIGIRIINCKLIFSVLIKIVIVILITLYKFNI